MELTISISQVCDNHRRLLFVVLVFFDVSLATSPVVMMVATVEAVSRIARQPATRPTSPGRITARGVSSFDRHLGSKAVVTTAAACVNSHYAIPFTSLG